MQRHRSGWRRALPFPDAVRSPSPPLMRALRPCRDDARRGFVPPDGWPPDRVQLANDRANADNARPLMPDVRIRPPRIAAALAIGTLFLAAGCGGSEKPDPARGKELFTQRCGACHILENAGTKGVQGPNLDLAFKQSVADGLGRSTDRGRGQEADRPSSGRVRCRPIWSRARTRTRWRPTWRARSGRRAQAAEAARRAPRRRTRRTRCRSPRTRTVSSRTSSRAPRRRPGR